MSPAPWWYDAIARYFLAIAAFAAGNYAVYALSNSRILEGLFALLGIPLYLAIARARAEFHAPRAPDRVSSSQMASMQVMLVIVFSANLAMQVSASGDAGSSVPLVAREALIAGYFALIPFFGANAFVARTWYRRPAERVSP